MRIVLPLLFALSLLSPARAEELNHAKEYEDCLALARTDPVAAWDKAISWEAMGGAEAARHCQAMALIGQEEYGAAAERLEKLAEDSRSEDPVRLGMLVQAAEAWSWEHQWQRADAVLTAALHLAPRDPDLYLKRATVLARAENYGRAEQDLTEALKYASHTAEIHALRASARRMQGDFKGAYADIQAALKEEPENLAALVERGMLYRLGNQNDLARQDWLTVLRLDETSPAADTARRNLEMMDVHVEAPPAPAPVEEEAVPAQTEPAPVTPHTETPPDGAAPTEPPEQKPEQTTDGTTEDSGGWLSLW